MNDGTGQVQYQFHYINKNNENCILQIPATDEAEATKLFRLCVQEDVSDNYISYAVRKV